jgi:hypothetical protein
MSERKLNPDALLNLYEALASIVTCASMLRYFQGASGQKLMATCNAALAKARSGEQP